ncbi:metallophosphoesterase family protein [Mesorhizobium tianshanense]|nr:metallophosphoesterase [Mesorhizobium tianshanense]
MARHHVIQISDLHLSEERSYNQPGWEACVQYIKNSGPEFVAVTGDLVLDDPDRDEDHHFVRSQLDRISAPWASIPGNHDIGDTHPNPYMGQRFDVSRLQRYRRSFGADFWTRELGDWLLIGLNAMLPGSGLQVEAEQYEWLREIAHEDPNRPTALFLHKPLCINRIDEESSPDACVVDVGRDRLLSVMQGVNLRFVASGHNHHYRTLTSGEVKMVWAPSTAQILHMARPFTALLRPGLVNFWLDDDGSLEFGLVEPSGMVATDVTDIIRQYGAMRSAPVKQWRV